MFYATAPSREWAGGREATGLTVQYLFLFNAAKQSTIGHNHLTVGHKRPTVGHKLPTTIDRTLRPI